MSSVDSRIVDMQFNNQQFERGAAQTMSTVDALKKSLNFTGVSKSLDDISQASGKVNLSTLEGGVTRVSTGFMAMATIAITALSNITTKAMSAGAQLAKSLTVDPVKAGLREYETNLNAVQTILANTSSKGTGLDDVNAALEELNEYSDKTIYNFSEMARNIGTFTAAGVDLDTSTEAIKGIANLAAVSGSNAQQASTAMYQLSQALASGRVSLMDWNSVVNAGMGGEVFQKALIRTAEAHGVAASQIIKQEGSFRDSLQTGWLSGQILTETLSQFTGDLTEKEIIAMGYTRQQAQEIVKMGATAVDAATKVKTMSQLVSTLQETAGSGWAKTWQVVFGDFEEAKTLFTNINDVLGGMISASADARNKVLGDWKKLGGRQVIIFAISNAFKALMDILKPIGQAFRDIFPAKTGKQLYDMSVALNDFTNKLFIGDEAAENLKRTFRGVFAIFSIGWQVIKGIAGVIGDLIGALAGGSGGILKFTGSIGDFLVSIDSALKKGDLLTNFFDVLGNILQVPIQIFGAFAAAIGALFSGFNQASADGITGSLGNMSDRLSPLQTLFAGVNGALSGLSETFSSFGQKAGPIVDAIIGGLVNVGEAIGEAFSGGDFSNILDTINTGLFGALVLAIKKFLSGDLLGSTGTTGMFSSITEAFGQLSGTLQAMQQNIKAGTIVKIATAVGILTASIVALSLIDSAKLSKALTAITVAFAQLLGAMAILDKITASGGLAKMPALAGAMILLSVAILILTAAVKNLADLDWEGLAKGLLGVTALLAIVTIAAKPLSASSKGMTRAGIGILALAIGLKVLASAVEDFSTMSWGDMAKGLGGVAASLLIIAGAMRLMPKNIGASAVGIVILSTGLTIMAEAIKMIGGLDIMTIVKGLGGIGAALVIVAGAMRLMPKNMLVTAAGLVLVSFALQGIGKTIESLGGLSWSEIVKGLVAIAGALVILAIGLSGMSGTIAGSAALLLAAVALRVLTPVLVTLGTMSWGEIVKGLLTLGAAFLVLGAAGYLLAPVSPIIAVLGLAIMALGAGLALAGAGVLAFSAAISVLAGLGGAVTAVVIGLLNAIISSIPKAMKAFGEGIVAFASAIAKGGPAFVSAMTTVLVSILTAIRNALPQFGQTFLALINTMLNVLTTAIPRIAAAGLRILISLLTAISNNIYRIVTIATNIITRFLNGIADNIPRIVSSGVRVITNFINAISNEIPKLADKGAKAVVKFVNGVASAIENNSGDMRAAGRRLATAIIDGMTGGLASGANRVIEKAKSVARSAYEAAKRALGVDSPSKEFGKLGRWSAEGFAAGLDKYSRVVETASKDLGGAAILSMNDAMRRVYDLASEEISMSPVISPVIDLTQVRKDADQIGSLIKANPITATISYENASAILAAQSNTLPIGAEVQPGTGGTVIQLEQNNYSPKALSAIDIYRQTKNQLALAKEALTA